jgi:hypothetical protein
MPRLDDGYRTLVTLTTSDITLAWEKSVTPPGVDNGGEIDVTTMHNGDGTTGWRTFAPRALKSLTESSCVMAYDPAVLDEIMAAVGVNQLITIAFRADTADEATWSFWGWLKTFTPGECTEGEQPTATVTFFPSNQNDSQEEVAPDYSL